MSETVATANEQCTLDGEDFFLKYMTNGFPVIKGWPGNRPSVEFNIIFRQLFSEVGEGGGVCEIGVHHGRYLIALHNLFGDRKSLGIDLFYQQSMNVDSSGKGDLEICKNNINTYVKKPELITLLSADSLAMSVGDMAKIADEFGKFAIFSIDGGHTRLHINIDLDNASKMTSDNGIIIIDDIFHPDWPEVTEGLYNSIISYRTPFVPFLITRKKLYMCSASVQKRYAKFAADNRGPKAKNMKMVNFAGWTMPSINFGSEY